MNSRLLMALATPLLMLLALCFPYGFYFLAQQDLNTIWEAAGATPPE